MVKRNSPRIADRDELSEFIGTIFKHANAGYITLRAFEGSGRVFQRPEFYDITDRDLLTSAAYDFATEAAQHDQPVTFCPPVCSFNDTTGAGATNVKEAYVLTVDFDEEPGKNYAKLVRILGRPTLTVESGSFYKGDEDDPKLHAHWVLDQPATKDNIDILVACRKAALLLANGDKTNAPVVHPIRWPGSWNEKATPRLCRIAENTETYFELNTLRKKLQDACKDNLIEFTISSPGERVVHEDSDELLEQIREGTAFHNPTTALSMRYAKRKVPPDVTINLLRSVMRESGDNSERWQDRYDDLPRLVKSAYAKVEFGPVKEIEDKYYPIDNPVRDDPLTIPVRDWIIPGKALAKKVSLMIAPPGAGKSTLALGMCLAAATGKPLFGYNPVRPVNALYYNNEDDPDELHRRLIALCKYANIDRSELYDAFGRQRLFLISGQDTPEPFIIAERMDNSVKHTVHRDRMVHSMLKNEIRLAVFDPLFETHEANENDNREMGLVARHYRYMAEQSRAAIHLIHHSKKHPQSDASGYTGNMDSARGASSLLGVARIAQTMYPMTRDEANLLGISEEERSLYVRVDDAKSNMSRVSGKPAWYRRETIRLPGMPVDEHGFPMEGSNLPAFEEVGILAPYSFREHDPHEALVNDVYLLLKAEAQHLLPRAAIVARLRKNPLYSDMSEKAVALKLRRALPEGTTDCRGGSIENIAGNDPAFRKEFPYHDSRKTTRFFILRRKVRTLSEMLK